MVLTPISNRSAFVFRTTVLLALWVFFASESPAQVGKSGITGTVRDPTGAAVVGARVIARNQSTNVEFTTTTGEAGTYFLRGLSVGAYMLTAQVQGFETVSTRDVQTEVDRVSTVDFNLKVGSTAETINVEANANPVNTVSGTVGNLVSGKEIEDVPLNGRNWVTLNLLSPGAASFHGTSMTFSNITESVSPGNFVVNGLRGGNNLYFIDGVNLQNVEDEILSILPPLESLQEFRTQTSNPAAEFTGGAGAMVTAVTKSGTNSLHGSLWEYLRNSDLDARNFFDAQVPPLRRNQYGVAAGGPIRKDRTFWFGSWEGFRQVKGQTFVGDYPTAGERAGNFSGSTKVINDPLTGKPFPGNIIPSSRINPLSTQWLNSFIPLPNTNVPEGSGNFRTLASQPIAYDTYMARVDQRIGQKGNLFGRYFYTLATSEEPTILPDFSRTQHRAGHDLAVQYTHTLNAKLVLEGRFGYHVYDDREPEGNAGNVNMLNALGVQNDPNFTHNIDSALAPPQISVTGLSQFGTSFLGRPRRIYNRSFYYDGSAFLSAGSHAMKMGGNLINNRANFPEIILPTGAWSYNGFFSGSGTADLLLGLPRSVSSDPDLFDPASRRWTGGLWFQDDWKVSSRLSVNIGVRFDIDTRYISANNSVANFDLSKPPLAINITPATRPAGWSRALVDGPQYLWSPRIGFAYKLHGDHTVLRGGYGIYWQPMTADPFVNYSINPPFIRTIGATFDTTNLSTFNRSLPLASSSASGVGATGIQKNFRDGYVQQWNLTLEHSIGATLFSAAYVGNKGTDLYQSFNVNLAPPGPGPINPRRPYTQLVVAPGGVVPPGTYPATGISLQGFGANSNYNGLQVKVQRRFSKNLSFTASYAWSKAIDSNDGSGIESYPEGLQQPLNPKAERGLAAFDIPQSLTFNYIYLLPFGHGQKFLNSNRVLDKIAGGWQVEGITTLQSGSPFTILNGYDNLNNGGTGYPDLVCNPNYGLGRSTSQKVAQFFNTACFVPPAGGVIGVPNYTFGNEGRNTVFGPGTNFWSAGAMKSFSVERVRVEFKTEFFNVFNHPNFSFLPHSVFDGTPELQFGTPQFGKLSFTGQDSREIQFGLKVTF